MESFVLYGLRQTPSPTEETVTGTDLLQIPRWGEVQTNLTPFKSRCSQLMDMFIIGFGERPILMTRSLPIFKLVISCVDSIDRAAQFPSNALPALSRSAKLDDMLDLFLNEVPKSGQWLSRRSRCDRQPSATDGTDRLSELPCDADPRRPLFIMKPTEDFVVPRTVVIVVSRLLLAKF